MNEREELKKELEQELYLINYRMKMLDIMEEKLSEMRKIAEWAKAGNVSGLELELLNIKLSKLAQQVKAIEEESGIL